jgi:hypothetical protein
MVETGDGVRLMYCALIFVPMRRYFDSTMSRLIEGATEDALAALADMAEDGAVEVDWVVSSLLSDPRKEDTVVPSLAFRL